MALLVVGLVSCTAPRFGIDTPEGRAAIIAQTKIALTNSECGKAIDLIEDLYQSQYTDNEIRLLRASAHGCAANINFFSLVNDLTENDLNGSEFWISMARIFPSVSTDGRSESAWFATDALHAALDPEKVVTDDYQINSDTVNMGSLLATDRIDDANAYLAFVSMSLIGSLQNRFGDPDTTSYKKRNDLPWISKADMTETGCSYAGAIINLLDALEIISDSTSGTISTSLASIAETLDEGISASCALGCAGFDWNGTPGVDGDCTYDLTECATCPTKIRNRTACLSDEKSACAAAGIVRMINSNTTLGWPDAS